MTSRSLSFTIQRIPFLTNHFFNYTISFIRFLSETLHLSIDFQCFLSFSKSTFSKITFRNTTRVSNSLDPDQARQFVGPDVDPNCLQGSSADDTVRQIVMPFLVTKVRIAYA